MRSLRSHIPLSILLAVIAPSLYANVYPWHDSDANTDSIVERIPAPPGYTRIDADSASFTAWLRGLPVGPDSAQVYMFDGSLRPDQTMLESVIDIDIGDRDLQQCADAAMRLRAEYLRVHGRSDEIAFVFTSGDTIAYDRWIEGWRPEVDGNDVTWRKRAQVDTSYAGFREYLDSVFMYAGSYSLQRDLPKRERMNDMMPGDLFIDGGFPGHVVIVIDVAVHDDTGERLFLCAQGFTPAQDFHVLVNPNDTALSPWYRCTFGDTLITPDWKFTPDDLHYFE